MPLPSPADSEPSRELMESHCANAMDATMTGFRGSVLAGMLTPAIERLMESCYRMGFESGWRIRGEAVPVAQLPKQGGTLFIQSDERNYAAIRDTAQLVEAGMQKSDTVYLTSASGGNDLLSALPRWEPIDTAPKDAQILLGRMADVDEDGEPRDGCVAQGYWMEGCDDGPDVMGYDAAWSDCNYSMFTAPRSFGIETYRDKGFQPTHWMPLPAPPGPCPYCDGTGDVHGLDGEWKGRCVCARVEPIAGPSSEPLLKDKKDSESMTSSPPSAPLAQPAQKPVARVLSFTNGSHWRNYRLEWLRDVPEGALLYAAPAPSQREVLDAARAALDAYSAPYSLGGDSVLHEAIDRLAVAVAAMSAGKTGEQP